ncbi:MAG: hypothetical protein PHI31_10735 [Desulfuromonadaceae bacterium]|nr:hypothetical protein [Desulfuromonadaceae bacterium]
MAAAVPFQHNTGYSNAVTVPLHPLTFSFPVPSIRNAIDFPKGIYSATIYDILP